MKYFLCTPTDFNPVRYHAIRWLDPDHDYEIAQDYWRQYQVDLDRGTWNKAHAHGYQYAARIEHGQIVSLAAVWRFSERAWEVAAVSTLEPYRRQGYSKQVVAFVTDYILNAGRWATCNTQTDNRPMIATAQSIGFREIAPERVLWTYPKLPDF